MTRALIVNSRQCIVRTWPRGWKEQTESFGPRSLIMSLFGRRGGVLCCYFCARRNCHLHKSQARSAEGKKCERAAASMIFATTLEIQFCKLRDQSLIFVYVPYKLAPTAQSLHSANRLFLSAGKAKEKRVVDYTHGSSSVLTAAWNNTNCYVMWYFCSRKMFMKFHIKFKFIFLTRVLEGWRCETIFWRQPQFKVLLA